MRHVFASIPFFYVFTGIFFCIHFFIFCIYFFCILCLRSFIAFEATRTHELEGSSSVLIFALFKNSRLFSTSREINIQEKHFFFQNTWFLEIPFNFLVFLPKEWRNRKFKYKFVETENTNLLDNPNLTLQKAFSAHHFESVRFNARDRLCVRVGSLDFLSHTQVLIALSIISFKLQAFTVFEF